MKSFLVALILLIAGLTFSSTQAQSSGKNTKDIWVATDGNNASKGTKASPLRTLEVAWNRVPDRKAKVNIYLTSGDYTNSSPNYWELKSGDINIIAKGRSAADKAEVILPAVNIYRVKGLNFTGITFRGDIHCELCKGFGLRNVSANLQDAWEVIKINQSKGVYIRGSRFSGAGDNVLDLVAVQNAKIIDNRFSDAGDWCAYAKGGSANVIVKNNLFQRCGTGGFTAGQGTGFQFMTAPWIRYEAYDVRVIGNTVRDTEGAAFGVNGGRNVSFIRNSALNVGQRSHVIEVGFGQRSCDGAPGADKTRLRCGINLRKGGWGTTKQDSAPGGIINIPNRNVRFIGNVISSPSNTYDGNQQILSIRGKLDYQPGSNVPKGSSGDQGLVFRKNIVWVSPKNLNIGIGDDACRSSNPTCNLKQLRANNRFNKVQPTFRTLRSGKLLPSGFAANYIK